MAGRPSEYPGWNVKKRRGKDGRYRLADGTPRAFRNHTTKAAREYCQYVRDLTATLGGLPRAADPLLREAGRIVVELNRGHGELEQMRQLPGSRQGEERGAIFRLERTVAKARAQLIVLERHLTELAKVAGPEGPRSGPMSGSDLVEKAANGGGGRRPPRRAKGSDLGPGLSSGEGAG